MLTAQDLAYTRATQGLTLVERAIVEHREVTDDGMGGITETTTYTGDVPCRVAPMRVQAAEGVLGGQLQGDLPWEITLPYDSVIDITDRLNVAGTLSGTPPNQSVSGGRWFEVMAKYGVWTNISALQCLCVER
jgi:hypothetical protein